MNARDTIISYAEANEDEQMYIIKLLVDRVDIYAAREVSDILVDPDTDHVYEYVGNCVNSFDEDGECIIIDLPFSDVTQLAYAIEEAKELPLADFKRLVNNNLQLEGVEITELYLVDDCLIAYDSVADIHYFFV